MDRGTFSLLNFYERRARRILPALFFVMAVSIPFAWMWLPIRDMKDFAQSLIAVSTFSSNILFLIESGYFEAATELKPLLHTWSLAVEEQYYILFPLLLMFTWRLGKRSILGILLVIGLASLGIAEWGAYNKPTVTFYLLPTRGWEILLGAFIAFYTNQEENLRLSDNVNQVLSCAGVLLVFCSIFLFDEQIPFPSFFTLVPTLGAALVILCANERTTVQRILCNRLLVGCGLISYSAYLWHQPIFAFVKQRSLLKPSLSVMIFLCALTLVLAFLSWRFVEKPFRSKTTVPRNVLFGASVVSASFFIFVGLVGHFNIGLGMQEAISNREIKLRRLLETNYGLSMACETGYGSAIYTESDECLSGSNPNAVLWGDSIAMHLAQALQSSPTNLSFRQHTMSVCEPLLGISVVGVKTDRTITWSEKCIEHNNRVFEWLKNNPDIRYVVLSSRFKFFNYDLFYKGVVIEYDFDTVMHSLVDTVGRLREIGKKVVIVSPPPGNDNDLGACFSKSYRFGVIPSECDFNTASFSAGTLRAFKFLKNVENFIPVIWLNDFICNKNKCLASIDGIPIYRDTTHLSKSGSALLGKQFDLNKLIIEKAE